MFCLFFYCETTRFYLCVKTDEIHALSEHLWVYISTAEINLSYTDILSSFTHPYAFPNLYDWLSHRNTRIMYMLFFSMQLQLTEPGAFKLQKAFEKFSKVAYMIMHACFCHRFVSPHDSENSQWFFFYLFIFVPQQKQKKSELQDLKKELWDIKLEREKKKKKSW